MSTDEESAHEVESLPLVAVVAKQIDTVSILDESVTKEDHSSGDHSKDDVDDEETSGLGYKEIFVESELVLRHHWHFVKFHEVVLVVQENIVDLMQHNCPNQNQECPWVQELCAFSWSPNRDAYKQDLGDFH